MFTSTNCGRYFNSFYKYKRKTWEVLNGKQKRLSSEVRAAQKPLNILFFGTDNFSLPSLKALHKNSASSTSNLGVVTSFKSPINCIRKYAQQENLRLCRWPITLEQCSEFDLGVVVSFGHLIPSDIIKAFPQGMINVHASLLPRWRGAAPIIYAILHGDTKTGVSIMQIEPYHFDVGDILAQREIKIKKNIFMPDLHTELACEGAKLLVDTVNNYSERLKNAHKQNSDKATYAPKITDDITEVNWSVMNAEQIFRCHRALFGYKPLTTTYKNRQVQLLDVRLPLALSKDGPIEPGSFLYRRDTKSLLLCCAERTYLEVFQLRLEGKKAMSSSDFNNGFLRQTKQCELFFSQNKKAAC